MTQQDKAVRGSCCPAATKPAAAAGINQRTVSLRPQTRIHGPLSPGPVLQVLGILHRAHTVLHCTACVTDVIMTLIQCCFL